MAIDIEAPGANDAELRAALLVLANSTTQGGFWADHAGANPVMHRFRDRVFIGNATLFHDNRSGDNGTWLPNLTVGANWGPRDSQLAVMQDRGVIAITGASRASDANDLAGAAPIGVAGFVINDTNVATRAAWGIYSDVQHEPNASISGAAASYGLEVAGKNKSTDITGHPYGLGYGVHGIWLQGGGDPNYGGSPTNPSNSAITILKNSSTWNRGIIFGADALTGSNGVTGNATAIALAKGHQVRWYFTGANVGATIRSDVNIGGQALSLVFDNNLFAVFGNLGVRIFSVASVTNNANYIHVVSTVASSPPQVTAAGSDTDIDLTLTPKGTGNVRFGTHTANADAAVSGYITIKDSGGTARKLAVIT